MSKEMQAAGATVGATYYAIVRQKSGGTAWNTSGTPAFEAEQSAHWASYAITMNFVSGTSTINADFPAIATPDRYLWTLYRQAGGSPSPTADTAVGTEGIEWNGTTVATIQSVNNTGQTTNLPTAGGGTVTLAASQPNYAPAKAGDAMALTSGERTTLAGAILSDTTDTLGADIFAIKAKTDALAVDGSGRVTALSLVIPCTVVAGSTASSIIASGLPAGADYKGQRLYRKLTGESKAIQSQSYSAPNYTFTLGTVSGPQGPYGSAPSAGETLYVPN